MLCRRTPVLGEPGKRAVVEAVAEHAQLLVELILIKPSTRKRSA
jgi:hypothetical protein